MTVSEIYTYLGQKLFDAIPSDIEDWDKTTMYAKRLDRYFSGWAKLFLNEKTIDLNDFEARWEMAQHVHELHSITTKGGNNKWNRLEFTLFPDFKFDLKFIWDQELQD